MHLGIIGFYCFVAVCCSSGPRASSSGDRLLYQIWKLGPARRRYRKALGAPLFYPRKDDRAPNETKGLSARGPLHDGALVAGQEAT